MKSIILNDHEAAGVIAGTVTQLRRPIKNIEFTAGPVVGPNEDGEWCFGDSYGCEWIRCPYPSGSKVWAKEAWAVSASYDAYEDGTGLSRHIGNVQFKAGGGRHGRELVEVTCFDIDGELGKWRSARSMPEWASRTTLLITSARPQQLKDVALDDAVAEGIEWDVCDQTVELCGMQTWYADWGELDGKAAGLALRDRWNADPRNRGHKWEPELWTWVYRVEVATA